MLYYKFHMSHLPKFSYKNNVILLNHYSTQNLKLLRYTTI